jgi:hypothetical protein
MQAGISDYVWNLNELINLMEQAMEDEHTYKGHRIRLLARMLSDDEWSCSYGVTRFGKTEMGGFSGDESGNTAEESKQQALEKAQKRIDSILN